MQATANDVCNTRQPLLVASFARSATPLTPGIGTGIADVTW